jgi:hypothetical protein
MDKKNTQEQGQAHQCCNNSAARDSSPERLSKILFPKKTS